MDDSGPTPGAGPCIQEILELDSEMLSLLYDKLNSGEEDFYDVLLHESMGIEYYARVFVSMECLQILDFRVRGCSEEAKRVLYDASEWPEVSRVAFEAGCLELIIPTQPPERVSSALARFGVPRKLKPLAYKIAEVEKLG